jgi:hypothetical protein
MNNKEKLNEWNWSMQKEKWVYIEEVDGEKKYTYSDELPDNFKVLSDKLTSLNRQMMKEEDPDRKNLLFKQMMEISKKMNKLRVD